MLISSYNTLNIHVQMLINDAYLLYEITKHIILVHLIQE